jgi:hypothetical protein
MQDISQSKMTDTAELQQQGRSFGSGLYRHSVASFMFALAVMLISAPFIEQLKNGDMVVMLMFTIVLLFAVLAVGNNRMTLVWAIILVIPAVIAKWANHWWPDLTPPTFFPVLGILFIMFVIANLFHFIFRAPCVDSEVLCAGIAAYMMICLLFALAYGLVAFLVPNSFSFTAAAADNSMKGYIAIYFSFITLCTVGYGDIIPVSAAARSLAVTEGAIGVLYVAILIARLVALYSLRENAEKK